MHWILSVSHLNICHLLFIMQEVSITSEVFKKKLLFVKLKRDAISSDIMYFYNNIDGN